MNCAQPLNPIVAGASTAPGYTLIDVRPEANNLFGRDVTIAGGGGHLADKTYVLGGAESCLSVWTRSRTDHLGSSMAS